MSGTVCTSGFRGVNDRNTFGKEVHKYGLRQKRRQVEHMIARRSGNKWKQSGVTSLYF